MCNLLRSDNRYVHISHSLSLKPQTGCGVFSSSEDLVSKLYFIDSSFQLGRFFFVFNMILVVIE